MSIKKHIPNTITCCNLVCGCIATGFAWKGNYEMALSMIIIGNVFDFFDGFSARLLKVSSPVGKELDSLADVVTSGVAPATIVFGLLTEVPKPFADVALFQQFAPYFAFFIAALSGLRLAKFNLDTRQTTTFIGLPTPANALFWAALAVGAHDALIASEWSFYALLVGVVLSSYMLVAELPMFALKFKSFGLSGNLLKYGFIVLSAALLLWLGWTGFSLVVVCYIAISIVANLLEKK